MQPFVKAGFDPRIFRLSTPKEVGVKNSNAHFTQIVNENTTRIGCAKRDYPFDPKYPLVLICNYYKLGNVFVRNQKGQIRSLPAYRIKYEDDEKSKRKKKNARRFRSFKTVKTSEGNFKHGGL